MTEREDSCISGTSIGGQRAAATNKAKHGDDFYAKIGAKGGHLGTTGGFGAGEKGRQLAREAGRKGGLARQGKKYPGSHSKNGVWSGQIMGTTRIQEIKILRPINSDTDILFPIKKSLFSRIFKREK